MQSLHSMDTKSPAFIESVSKMTGLLQILAAESGTQDSIMQKSPETATSLIQTIVIHLAHLIGDESKNTWLDI